MKVIEKHSATEYFRFLNSFEKSLGSGRRSITQKFSNSRLQGLFNLVSTFPTGAPADLNSKARIQEWNPIGQRVYFRTPKKLRESSLTTDFEVAQETIDRFIEISHEVSHILLMEPFFTGEKKYNNTNFLTDSMVFEGYCFWYADIIVTRALRVRFSDGEFVRGTSAVSQPSFHPYRAFKALGIKNDHDILKIYLDAFDGEQTKLFKHKNKAFVGDLFERFGKIYIFNRKSITLLKKQLNRMKIFDKFASRFCFTGLPALLPREIMKIEDPKQFCISVYRNGMPYISEISKKKLENIRLRRFIQVRAYTAYALISVIENNLYVSRKKNKLNVTEILERLYLYLDKLELSLKKLVDGGLTSKLIEECKKNDFQFDRFVRLQFKKSDVWVSQRHMIYPHLMDRPLGLINKDSILSKKEITTILEELVKAILNGNQINQNKLVLLGKKFRLISRMLRLYNQNAPSRKQLNHFQFIRDLNSLMLSDDHIRKWSFPLHEISASKNRFREPLFVFR